MPIYDYVCTQCGQRVEVVHGIHAAGPSTCEECGGRMRKALSAPAIVFKGSGWAKVDARSGGAKKRTDGAAAAGEGASKSAAGSTGAGEGGGSSSSSSQKGSGSGAAAETKAGSD